MSYLALYREWRPKNFDQVVEQTQVVYALRQAVINRQISHAYLFSGTRGTGKTTVAKIFARAINCLRPEKGNPCNKCDPCTGILDGSLIDVVEMDAASNNSVDNIRRICDEVVFMPSVAKYKVYIIDEVHMLSTGAFNALLKTLEEPPEHAVFLLATTEPYRLPPTILSRCQRYDFRRIPFESIITRLKEITKAHQIQLTADAYKTIATFADGALRDAISLLDQVSAGSEGLIDRNQVLALAGITQDDTMLATAQAILFNDVSTLLACVEETVMSGRDVARFLTDLLQFFRNILVCSVSDNPRSLIQTTDVVYEAMQSLAQETASENIIRLIQSLSELSAELRFSSDSRIALEVGIIRSMGIAQATPLHKLQPLAQRQTAKPAAVAEAPPAKYKTATATKSTESLTGKPEATVQVEIAQEEISQKAPPQELQPPAQTLTDKPAELEMAQEEVAHEEKAQEAAVQVEVAQTLTDKPAELEIAALWPQILNKLEQEGEMILYLFAKTASVQSCNNLLHIIFAENNREAYNKLKETESQTAIREIIKQITDVNIEFNIRLEQNPLEAASSACIKAEEPWLEKVRSAAKQLGIPVNMEE